MLRIETCGKYECLRRYNCFRYVGDQNPLGPSVPVHRVESCTQHVAVLSGDSILDVVAVDALYKSLA